MLSSMLAGIGENARGVEITDGCAVSAKDAVEVRGVFAVSSDEVRATSEVVLPGLPG